MRIEDFDFHLPLERIAQKAKPRGYSRLLVLPKIQGAAIHTSFRSVSHWLKKEDCLVVNDTKVIPARLYALKVETQAQIELMLHREIEPGLWEALARPCCRLKPGMELKLGRECVRVKAIHERGQVLLRFASSAAGKRIIQKHGITPLPPYICRDFRAPNANEKKDRQRYQTLFAAKAGSVAAPTAGLHFSSKILTDLQAGGIHVVPVTLHVGWGTFAPLSKETWKQKKLHPERYSISPEAANRIRKCREQGKRVIACGTTVARTLEAATAPDGTLRSGSGETDIFITPGYRWKQVNGLLTNFHLPKSSLFMLVSALVTRERLLNAYQTAIREKYRFYSYGDAMLCI
ncbi:tRNA preQ1(34) S-adenosylmethionine ribosyltransferase-isomerase QueA [bacterium]|nr:tRNA preQ1(34) S-adenosylmethionine ribosyltransferase-isomerase QueA [bacterium]